MIPKFRVFAKAGTECVYGGGYKTDEMFYEVADIDFTDNTITVWGCGNKDCGLCDDTYKIEDVEIMQSNGFKDKNGDDEYEGDIFKVYEDGKCHICVLEYNKDEAHYQLTNYKTEGETIADFLYFFGRRMSELEVIGNIYENPELLEVPNEII